MSACGNGTLGNALPLFRRLPFSAAFSPDGKSLLTAGAEPRSNLKEPPTGNGLLWDLATRRLKAGLMPHGRVILDASFSPDGKLLATTAFDARDVRVWEVSRLPEPGAGSRPFVERPASIVQPLSNAVTLALAYSPDGRLLAQAGEDKTITLSKAATGELVKTLTGHTDIVAGLAFAPDSQTLASASYDKTVRLWDIAAGTEKATLQGHSNWVLAVAFAPDGKTLASASYDKLVKLWDVATAKEIANLAKHTASVRAVAFAPDGQTVASAGNDRVVRLWDAVAGSARGALKGHKKNIRALAFSPDGKTLASAAEDNTIKLWDPATGNERATLTGHEYMVTCIAFDPKGTTLLSAAWDGRIKLWDMPAGKQRAEFPAHDESITALALAPGGQQLTTAGVDKRLKVWTPASSSPGSTTPAAALSASPTPAPSAPTVLPVHGKAGWFVAYSHDGTQIATGGERVVKILDSTTHAEKLVFVVPTDRVNCGAFSPDDNTLATGGFGNDPVVRLWDLTTGRPKAILGEKDRFVFRLAFTTDGETLAATCGPGTVRLWDPVKARAIGSIAVNARGLSCAGLCTQLPDPGREFSPGRDLPARHRRAQGRRDSSGSRAGGSCTGVLARQQAPRVGQRRPARQVLGHGVPRRGRHHHRTHQGAALHPVRARRQDLRDLLPGRHDPPLGYCDKVREGRPLGPQEGRLLRRVCPRWRNTRFDGGRRDRPVLGRAGGDRARREQMIGGLARDQSFATSNFAADAQCRGHDVWGGRVTVPFRYTLWGTGNGLPQALCFARPLRRHRR